MKNLNNTHEVPIEENQDFIELITNQSAEITNNTQAFDAKTTDKNTEYEEIKKYFTFDNFCIGFIFVSLSFCVIFLFSILFSNFFSKNVNQEFIEYVFLENKNYEIEKEQKNLENSLNYNFNYDNLNKTLTLKNVNLDSEGDIKNILINNKKLNLSYESNCNLEECTITIQKK